MNTTALAVIQPDELETIQRTAKLLAASGFFQTTGDSISAMAQVAAKILAGRELGFGPFAAVNGIHIIQGRPAVGANLMAAAVRSHPRYDYKVKELTDKVCELEFFDNGKSAGVSRFTIQEAQTAELTTGKNAHTWKKYARNMLFARAMSNGVRWYAPDIFSGNAIYVPEELGADVNSEGDVIEVAGRRVEPSTGEIIESPQTEPEIDFGMGESDGPTDEENDIISTWQTPEDAKVWAVNVGACANEFEAKNSFKKIVEANGGRLTKSNVAAVFLQFLRRQMEKLEDIEFDAQIHEEAF